MIVHTDVLNVSTIDVFDSCLHTMWNFYSTGPSMATENIDYNLRIARLSQQFAISTRSKKKISSAFWM